MRLKYTIIGKKVHDVGYKAILLNEALALGVDNFNVYNAFIDGREAVIILIEGEKEQIDGFKEFIKKIKSDRAIVDEIKEESYSAKIPSIDRTIQVFQMEQWNKGIPILLEIRDNTKLIPQIAENTKFIPEIINNTRSMLLKQDETIREIRELRSDLKSYLDYRFAVLEAEIAKIKQKIGMS